MTFAELTIGSIFRFEYQANSEPNYTKTGNRTYRITVSRFGVGFEYTELNPDLVRVRLIEAGQ